MKKQLNKNREARQGSALVLVIMFVLIGMIGSLALLRNARNSSSISNLNADMTEANYEMETAYSNAKAKLNRSMSNLLLMGKLPTVNHSLTDETAFSIVPAYTSPGGTEIQFLKDMVKSQAVNADHSWNTSSEFYPNFDTTVFPTTWTDMNSGSGQYYQEKYTFNSIPIISVATPVTQYVFQYEYIIQVRSYGGTKFSSTQAEDAGLLTITLQGAPFSQWSLFRSQTTSPSGATLYFAGGDTSSQIQEVFNGPVHTNETPNFMGHPTFRDLVTSAVAYASWNKQTTTNYSGAPSFTATASGSSYNTAMPTQIFNTARLAAGDTSATASTNNTTYTNAQLVSWLSSYAGGTTSGAGGTFTSSTSSVPTGIYIPVDNSTSKNPTGGIYVQGDAKIVMDVVRDSSGFPSNQWTNVAAAHRTCKFQKVSITSLTSGVLPRDIYIAADPCNVTYVFDATTSSSQYYVVNGRTNGNIHVNGNIDELGGASRTRPAVAEDFGITVSATKDVRIRNDLQYEDVSYVTMDTSGTTGTTAVANAYGTIGSSGYTPSSSDIAGQIPSDSKTVLGIVSVSNSVVIHQDAPSNINVHAAIYAGNSAASSSGLGCGSGSYAGCGFGVENYTTATGKGNLKLFGSISEYRSQGIGVLSPSTGYARRYYWDTRLRQALMPPAFPISNQLQAYPIIQPMKTFRISSGH